MYYEGGKYYPSKNDVQKGKLACPTCTTKLVANQTTSWAGYECRSCTDSICLEEIKCLPKSMRDVFVPQQEFTQKVESLKDVVDELQKRGVTDKAYALANLIAEMVPNNTTAIPANVVEACRLLDLAEASAGDLPQAARISSIRLDIQQTLTRRE